MTDNKDPQTQLRDLANKWALRARDYARDSKTADAPADKTAYTRGLAEGFYKAATELAEVLKAIPTGTAISGVGNSSAASAAAGGTANGAKSSAAATASAVPPAEPPAPVYLDISLREAMDVLTFAGVSPRDIQPRPDRTFMVTFSRWENIQPHERIAQVKQADMRLVVLESGKLKDTHDPFILFAFKSS